MTRVEGGFGNRTYRLDTDQGSFAVKELNLLDRRSPYRLDDVFRFEQAAFAAGIPMPEPVLASHDTLVHRWVEGEKVPEAAVSTAYAFELGEVLARLHALDVEWTHVASQDPTPRDWPELARRAALTGQPWADELARNVEKLLAIAGFVDDCPRPGPLVLTHRDIHPWNLLAREGRPVVLDWELSGTLDLGSELGSTALSVSKDRGFDAIEPDTFSAVLDGYVAGGGTLPPSGPHWFVFMIGGWLGHTRRNALRCLAGVDVVAGPDLAMSHEVVHDGVRGLPEFYARLPQLESLLP
jgi:aminoglycoside phosphotransferase (APT) family kinase protein